MNLLELNKNTSALILSIEDGEFAHVLLEYGLIPGRTLIKINKAPFGGPIYVKVDDNLISLRAKEAATIIVE